MLPRCAMTIPSPRDETAPRHVSALLLVLLGLAAVLRFTALDWGLRMPPHNEERLFVQSAAAMLEAGDLDHRFYEYGGAFVYLIAAPLALVPEPLSALGYLVARATVAACGVLSVFLAYLLGRRLAGAGCGLAAAARSAVSVVAVRTAHGVRPDVALETVVLCALLAFDRLDGRRRRDIVAGLLVGAATAMKFTGAFLGFAYLSLRAARFGFSRSAFLRMALAGLMSLVGFVALSPYALIHRAAFLVGLRAQARYQYVERSRSWLDVLASYAGLLADVLGVAGLVLALAGAVLAWRERERFAAVLAFPAVLLAVLTTADVAFERFLVPITGLLAVLAGRAVVAVGARSRLLAAALVIVAMAQPLAASVRYLRDIRVPGTRERAMDWIEAHVPPGSRIAVSIPDPGVDPRRYELVHLRRLDDATRLVARHADYVLARVEGEGRPAKALETLFVAEPEGPYAWRAVLVARFPDALRPVYEPVPVAAVEAAPNGFVVRLDGVQPVSRLDLRPGAGTPDDLFDVVVEARTGSEWRRLNAQLVRPALSLQHRGRSHVLAFKTVEADGLRVTRPRPWQVAGVEAFRAGAEND
jgi:hypothetical protein